MKYFKEEEIKTLLEITKQDVRNIFDEFKLSKKTKFDSEFKNDNEFEKLSDNDKISYLHNRFKKKLIYTKKQKDYYNTLTINNLKKINHE